MSTDQRGVKTCPTDRIISDDDQMEVPKFRIRNDSSSKSMYLSHHLLEKNASDQKDRYKQKKNDTVVSSIQKIKGNQSTSVIDISLSLKSRSLMNDEKVGLLLRKINGQSLLQSVNLNSQSQISSITKESSLFSSNNLHSNRVNPSTQKVNANKQQLINYKTNFDQLNLPKQKESSNSISSCSNVNKVPKIQPISSSIDRQRQVSFEDMCDVPIHSFQNQKSQNFTCSSELLEKISEGMQHKTTLSNHSSSVRTIGTQQDRKSFSSNKLTYEIINEDNTFDAEKSTTSLSSNKKLVHKIITEDDNLQYLQNFNLNSASLSENMMKNVYTSSDSRFKLINQLRNKNSNLENIIGELRKDIDGVDEFKAVLNKYNNNEEDEEELIMQRHQEKRIMLLKAQINKQQRHIRQLTSLLTTTRKTFKEVINICAHLLEATTPQSSLNQVQTSTQIDDTTQRQSQSSISPIYYGNGSGHLQGSQITATNMNLSSARRMTLINKEQDNKNIPTLPKSEDGMEDFFINQSSNQAQQQLYLALVGVEDRHKFVSNFNQAFQKVADFQYKNEEFNKLFSVKKSRHTQEKQIKFNHPIRMLCDEFQHLFPVQTLFDYVDANKRQNIQTRTITLMSVLRKTDRAFKKIRAYQLFQHNPICFKESTRMGDISIPNLLLENQKLFHEFIQPRGYPRRISLDVDKVIQTETSLSELLDKILSFSLALSARDDKFSEISDLVKCLRKSSEDLICLGILIPNDNSGKTGKDITLIAINQHTKETESAADTQKIAENKLKKSTQQQHNAQISSQITHEWLTYEQNMDVNTEFIEKKSVLSYFFQEFFDASQLQDFTKCREFAARIESLLDSFKTIFEAKENILKLKNVEISYLKNQATLNQQESNMTQEFVEQMQVQINLFFSPINQKLGLVVHAFTQLFDSSKIIDPISKANYAGIFKKNTKDILENIKKMQNCSYSALQQQFRQRIQLAFQRYNRIKPSIQQINVP